MRYRCISCKRIFPELKERIKCPFCGSRIFVKLRPLKVKRVRAR